MQLEFEYSISTSQGSYCKLGLRGLLCLDALFLLAGGLPAPIFLGVGGGG